MKEENEEVVKKEETTQERDFRKKLKKEIYYNYIIGFLTGFMLVIVISGIDKIVKTDDITPMETMDSQQKINLINRYLKESYVDKLDQDKIEEGMYKGMLYGVGDPYTSYFTKAEIAKFSEQMSGHYAGIGVMVELDTDSRLLTITNIFDGAPGAKAGLKIGDKIVKVNGEDVTLIPAETIIQKIKGKAGTKLKLSILRQTETLDIDLTRENVEIPTVKYKVLTNDIGYIQLLSFDEITISQFDNALKSLRDKKIKSLIIDLRNNPGGSLQTVIHRADAILPKGLIMYTENKNGKGERFESDDNALHMPLAVLVNENSASASEVLAGAIKAHGVGNLVGTKTFGKGVVQKILPLPDGSAIKVTVSKYYTPDKVCIQGIGIEPNYKVELPEELKGKPSLTDEEDIQLKKAIEVVGG